MDAMVEVFHLTKTFTDEAGAFDVIRDASFTIDKGEMVSLVGVSGAGKTTLLQILGGLDAPTAGEVRINGKPLGAMSAKGLAAFRNLSLGFVFQFHHLLPDFTALENVVLPGMIAGKTKRQCEARARELLELLGLSRQASHLPSELSGGERQRVALARSLFNQPALILADEPTGNLDKENGHILLELFKKANRELRQTFLVATHNAELTQGMHRTVYIEDGKIVSKGNLNK
ncbi:MAG TPA: ABC transporter ATP-binding protein [Chitinivibrionales bacterium]|nr:ABC transporter ATP-binding protein [Chitinivibrionales bacterium]